LSAAAVWNEGRECVVSIREIDGMHIGPLTIFIGGNRAQRVHAEEQMNHRIRGSRAVQGNAIFARD
jgi:hypothetical protein